MSIVRAISNNEIETIAGDRKEYKNIISLKIGSTYTIKANAVYEEVNTLVEYNKIGDKLTHSNSKVVIGAGVSKVLLSAWFMIQPASAATKYLRLVKNSDLNTGSISLIILTPSTTGGNGRLLFAFTPILLDVEEGDTLSLFQYGVVGDVLYYNSAATSGCLTVEVVN